MVNITNLTNAQNLGDFVRVADSFSGNFLVGGTIFALGIIFIMGLLAKGNEPDKTFAAVSYVMFVLSLFMLNAGFIDIKWVIFYLVGAVVTTMYLYISNRG